MAKGSVSDRALEKVLSNAKKLPTAQFNNLGTRTLQQIARSAEVPGRHQGEGRGLGSRAQRELMRRNSK